LDRGFSGLFENSVGDAGNDGKGASRFVEYYGWQYSTTQVAEYYRIPLNEAYELPTIEYLNALSYLKAYRDYLR
jgi:hypothetical protein